MLNLSHNDSCGQKKIGYNYVACLYKAEKLCWIAEDNQRFLPFPQCFHKLVFSESKEKNGTPTREIRINKKGLESSILSADWSFLLKTAKKEQVLFYYVLQIRL